ncbi:MAG TPA: histidine kinase [Arachnia sp.]|nr:histidine kinase [Arachnia sp.]HMT85526.1 histidine kinase [Arachnia sp.]
MDVVACAAVFLSVWKLRPGIAVVVLVNAALVFLDPDGLGMGVYLCGIPVMVAVRHGKFSWAVVVMVLTAPLSWYVMMLRGGVRNLGEAAWNALFWVFWFGVLWIVGLGMRAIERGAVARERAQQQERAQQLAVDLHDTVSQGLAQLALGLESASAPGGGGVTAEEAGVLAERAREANAMIRDVTTLLHAGGVDPLPGITLEDALVRGGGELRRRGFEVREVVEVPVDLPEDLSLAAGAVVREALNNVLRHGVAGSRCVVVVDAGEDELEISVINPFKAPSVPRRGGLGVQGMQMRARLARGRVDSRGVGDSWICEARFPIRVR